MISDDTRTRVGFGELKSESCAGESYRSVSSRVTGVLSAHFFTRRVTSFGANLRPVGKLVFILC